MNRVPTPQEAIENFLISMENLEKAIPLFREYAWFFEMQETYITQWINEIENLTRRYEYQNVKSKLLQWYKDLYNEKQIIKKKNT